MSVGCALFFGLAGCNNRPERQVQPSFYWWRTVFNPSPKELQTLRQYDVRNLYVKLFDVDWNMEKAAAEPVAKSIFSQRQPAGVAITPVVFITQEPLQKADSNSIPQLAVNIAKLLQSIATTDSLQLSNEVQIDCDWTAGTKDIYFHLLGQLKQQPFFKNKTLSATVRLHQLKFITQSGVPPVDKGLLMCYNMGNLRHPQTRNSIIDEDELKKYINNLNDYPLPLDVALPLFDWWVLFDGAQYKGIVREFQPVGNGNEPVIRFKRDTVIGSYAFRAGQWLRHETSDATLVKACADRIAKKLKSKTPTVILYHLHEPLISKYTPDELESFFSSFR